MNTTSSTDNNLSKPNNDDDGMNNSNDVLSSDNQPSSKPIANEADGDNINSNSQDGFNDNSIPSSSTEVCNPSAHVLMTNKSSAKNDNRNSPPPIAKHQKHSNQTQQKIKENNTMCAPGKEGYESPMLGIHNEHSEKYETKYPN